MVDSGRGLDSADSRCVKAKFLGVGLSHTMLCRVYVAGFVDCDGGSGVREVWDGVEMGYMGAVFGDRPGVSLGVFANILAAFATAIR